MRWFQFPQGGWFKMGFGYSLGAAQYFDKPKGLRPVKRIMPSNITGHGDSIFFHKNVGADVISSHIPLLLKFIYLLSDREVVIFNGGGNGQQLLYQVLPGQYACPAKNSSIAVSTV